MGEGDAVALTGSAGGGGVRRVVTPRESVKALRGRPESVKGGLGIIPGETVAGALHVARAGMIRPVDWDPEKEPLTPASSSGGESGAHPAQH